MVHESMLLQLAGLPPGHSVQRGRLEFVGRDAADEEEPYAVDVRCDIDNLGARVHIRGSLDGHAASVCHRCLAPFERSVQATFAVTLERGGDGQEGEELERVPETAAEYDLTAHVREAIALEEPIRLLCRPECRGLCAQCGADLNQGPCGCAPTVDPRWAPLDRLRDRS